MTILAAKLLEQGIHLRSYEARSHKATCPRCSSRRKKRTDPCLSVTIDHKGAVWKCHHCEWSGGVSSREPETTFRWPLRQKPAPVKLENRIAEPTAAVLAWFAQRGICEATVRRNKIGLARTWIPGLNAEVACIAFPYLRNGEVVNIKYRALADKSFAQVKGAEKILYGLDDVSDAKTVIIVEGEPDKLALEEAGYRNVVSVPDGAPRAVMEGAPDPEDPKFEYLRNCADRLGHVEKFILAVDSDQPGRALEEELARRLGKDRAGESGGRTATTWSARTPTRS